MSKQHVRHGLPPVMGLLLCSGFCALIYQTAWFRAFRLIFGASTFATAAVLAVFMAGLGAGSRILGARADRSKNPLLLYANLELAIAVTTGVTPLLILVVQWIYLRTGGVSTLGSVGAAIVRLVLSAIVLAPPTILMGGTLPAAARAVEQEADEGRHRVSALYGINTMGAVLGALASNFLLLEVFGTRMALWLACLLNLLVAMIARAVSRNGITPPATTKSASEPEELVRPKKSSDAGKVRRFAPIAAAISGGVFMLMELVWYRMLAPLLGGSSYTFGLILAVALAGIGIGGFVYARSRRPPTLTLFAITCAVEALFIAIPFAIGDRIAILALLLRPVITAGFGASVLAWSFLAIIVVLPAAIISGAQFPLIIALYGKGESNVGRDVGNAYLANTIGAIFGSIAGGFGLLPILSAPTCWRLVVVLLCATALTSAVIEQLGPIFSEDELRERRLARRGFALSLLTIVLAVGAIGMRGPTAAWRHSGIGAGRADRRLAGGTSPRMVASFIHDQQGLIRWEEDGIESTVAVGSGDGHAFVVNGKSDGHALNDAPTQVMSGILGALLHPNPKHSMVIGLGTGSTAGWLGALPSMERVDVVELEAATIRVARDCVDVNQNVLANPKVKIATGDAREALLTSSQSYDIIFSEPSNPYRAGVSSLYTKEFYSAASRRLERGGFFIQWVQAYEVDSFAVATVLTTVHHVFEHVSLWRTMAGDLLLVAQHEAPKLDIPNLRERVKADVYRDALKVWGTDSVEGVLTHFVADPSFADTMAKNELGLVNEDDLNVLEFAYARSVGHHRGVDTTIGKLAMRLNTAVPPIQGGEIDPIGILEERWLWQVAQGRPPEPAPEEVPTHARGLGLMLRGFLENRPNALDHWRKLNRKPKWLLEPSFVAELGVRVQAPDALALIDLDSNATERAVLRAMYAHRTQKDPAAALRHLEEGLTLARKDPWARPAIVSNALGLAWRLAIEHTAEMAAPIYNLLAVPLAAEGHRDYRLSQRARIGGLLDNARCVQALHDVEPAPYLQWLMDLRVRCYRDANDPLLKLAQKDREELFRFEGEFAGALESKVGATPHPFTITSEPDAPQPVLPARE